MDAEISAGIAINEEDDHSRRHHLVDINSTPEANFVPIINPESSCFISLLSIQKMMAEFVATYFLIFAGCGSVAVNMNTNNVVTLPGISMVWGLVVMVMIYSVGHISGAHFNPAVTIAFATIKRFSWNLVPGYVVVQVLAATLACGTLRLLFNGKENHFVGTLPGGSDLQSFVIEFILTFYLMFVITAVATDDRAVGQLAGLAIGGTISIEVLCGGPISGASMNPARSLGPAIVWKQYEGLWVYLVAPILGAICGAMTYNTMRVTNKPLREILKTGSFLASKGSTNST